MIQDILNLAVEVIPECISGRKVQTQKQKKAARRHTSWRRHLGADRSRRLLELTSRVSRAQLSYTHTHATAVQSATLKFHQWEIGFAEWGKDAKEFERYGYKQGCSRGGLRVITLPHP